MIVKKEYTEGEHQKVLSQIEELTQSLREYNLTEDAKSEITKQLGIIVTVLALEVSE